MYSLRFRSSLWISFYFAAMQYWMLSLSIPISIVLNIVDSSIWAIPLIPLLILALISFVALEDRSLGLIVISESGFSAYSLRKFSKACDFVCWHEIYQVEPYRFFGLPFLLVRYDRSEFPLWLPLFLTSHHKLKFVILERISEENPLKNALLNINILFKKVPWHSKARSHKSDRFILENSYATKIYCNFKQYFFYALAASSIILFLELVLCLRYDDLVLEKTSLILMGSVALLLFIIFGLMWHLIIKESYLEIKHEGLSFCTKSLHKYHKWFINWSAIVKVEQYKFLIFKELRLFTQNRHNQTLALYTIPQFWLFDGNKLKATIINNFPLDNPLYELVIKTL